jgi:hypothetical protein
MKEDEIGRARSMHGRAKCLQHFGMNPEWRKSFEEPGIDGRIILKRNLSR